MSTGLIHLYLGGGKGKTTAAIGLVTRAAGCGKRVVFAQFLKGRATGEIASLEALGVHIVRMSQNLGFVAFMDDAQKEICLAAQEDLLRNAWESVLRGVQTEGEDRKQGKGQDLPQEQGQGEEPGQSSDAGPDCLLVLDEVLDAVTVKMLDEEALRELVLQKPEQVELVLTGRAAPEWLLERADYITEMTKIKHPYDRGINARNGIEY